jgi:predicted small metal-binding protein
MKEFTCGAVVPGCTARFVDVSEDAILKRVAEHAQVDHGLVEVPAELVAQVRANISAAAA